MTTAKLCLVCILHVFVIVTGACAQEGRWKEHMDAADRADLEGNYQEKKNNLL
jgi:hypothetical protein